MSGNKRVVLIQDDSYLVETRKKILEHQGYSVAVVNSVKEARAVCHEFVCDLVIVDAAGSHNSALDLCEEIKKKIPGMNVALMVGYHVYLESECPDEVIRREDGPEGFLAKVENLLESA